MGIVFIFSFGKSLYGALSFVNAPYKNVFIIIITIIFIIIIIIIIIINCNVPCWLLLSNPNVCCNNVEQ